MRYLKDPQRKRNDPTIPWKQEGFSNIYRDIPASEIPNDGLADAINALLFGNDIFVRPGDEKYKDVALPITSSDLFTEGVAKSGDTVTHFEEEFNQSSVGEYIIWPSTGNVDQIIEYVDNGEVKVDTTTVETDTRMTIREQVFGRWWHEKSKLIFLHIGTKLFYAKHDFSTGWNELKLSSTGILKKTISTFDQEDDFVYLFNSGGTIMIDIMDSDNVFAMQINIESPENTIVLDTEERVVDDPGTNVDYIPTELETDTNQFGRYYIFSLTRLDGNWNTNRGEGARIIKETGTNLVDSDNEYRDFKTAWRMDGFANLTFTRRTNKVLALPASPTQYYNLQTFSNPGLSVTIEDVFTLVGVTREIPLPTVTNESWAQIATIIQKSLRNAFPEYKYLQVVYDDDPARLLFLCGEDRLRIGEFNNPTDYNTNSYDGIFDGTSFATDAGRYKTLGTKDEPALDAILQANPYTHYSIYSTRTDAPEFRTSETLNEDGELVVTPTPVDMSSFIWQQDVPIVKPFPGIIQKVGNRYHIYAEGLEEYDLGSWIKYTDRGILRSAKFVRMIDGVSTEEDSVHNNGDTVYTNDKASGSSDAGSGSTLIDATKDFVYLGVTGNQFIFNKNTLQMAYITAVTTTVLTLSENIFSSAGGETYVAGGKAMAIGSDERIQLSQTGNLMTRISGSNFLDSHQGDIIFLSDGTTNVVTEFVSPNSIKVLKSAEISRAIAAVVPNGRNYNDFITDKEIEARAVSLPANNRFFTALPDTDLGAIVPGFMAVANDGEMKGYYSQYNEEYRYYAGHYSSDIQKFVMNDVIKDLKRMPDHLIVFCKNSTHKFQTNVVNDAGDGIAVLSGQSVVDENIGISDRMGVEAFSGGLKFIVTSEPGLRQFDGYRYGENFLFDDRGLAHLNKDFQVLKSRIVAYYEPNLYGMMFWGINSVNTLSDGSPLLSKSNKCFRLAMEKQQGFGFAEIDGDDWNFIEVNNKPLRITDDYGNKITIVFDARKGYPHRLSTRKLPDQGGTDSEIDLNFKDNEDVGGGNGTEISGSIRLKEHIAKEEQWKLRYLEEYWFLRPYLESRKNADGYDEYGFRDAQELTIKAYTDGDATEISEAHTVNPKATIFQGYKIEDRRVQIGFEFTASELRITGTNCLYDVLKRREPPNSVQKEPTQQEWLSDILFRLSRGQKNLNLATGEEEDEGDPVYIEITGPDEEPGSAFYLRSGYLEYPAPENQFRQILFTIKPEENYGTVYLESLEDGTGIEFEWLTPNVSDGLRIYFNETTIIATLSINKDEWTTIMLTVDKASKTFSWRIATENLEFSSGSAAYSGNTTLSPEYGETIIIGTSQAKLFDFNIIDSLENEIDEAAFEYYAKDVHKYKGYSLIPIAEPRIIPEILESGGESDRIIQTGSQTDNYVGQGGI